MHMTSLHSLSNQRPLLVSATPNDPVGQAPVDFARLARTILKARRAREQLFGARLFADPGWDILLDLRAHHGSTKTVASLFVTECAPTTTGLRHLRRLERKGLVERWPDPTDARRRLVRLSDRGLKLMDRCLSLLLG